MSLTFGTAAQARPGGPATDQIRVMVVDDSVVARGLIGRWVDEDPALKLVASHRNGKLAVDDIHSANPDVVVLDVEMPEMDGLTALPLLLKARPGLVVIMASTLTHRNAEISLRCLALGAADYVPKPETNSAVTTSNDFRKDVVEKVRTLGQRARMRAAPRPAGGSSTSPLAGASAPLARPVTTAPTGLAARPASAPVPAPAAAKYTLRPYSGVPPRVLLVGSSTGGPQALQKLFTDIGRTLTNIPVLITQHMPPTFTTILADHLSKASGRRAAEGVHGEPVMPGRIYVAPGGKHMVLAKHGSDIVVELNEQPPVHFCRPAVDPLFQSAVPLYGSAILSAVLTGMGSDGANGAKSITSAGGSVIAQDEESSVVWGMPGAVAQAGAACEILPLDQIGAKIMRILQGGRP